MSSNGKGKRCNPRYKNKNKGGKTYVAVVTLHTSTSNEEAKQYISKTGSTMNKTFFLKSREEFLRYATTKFGNDVTFSLAKRKTALVHIQVTGAINYLSSYANELRQHEIKGKEWR